MSHSADNSWSQSQAEGFNYPQQTPMDFAAEDFPLPDNSQPLPDQGNPGPGPSNAYAGAQPHAAGSAPSGDNFGWNTHGPSFLQSMFNGFASQQQAMTSTLDAITQRLASMTGNPAQAPPSSFPSTQPSSTDPKGVPKFKTPPTFEGRANKVDSFINSIRGAIYLSRATLPTDRDKSLFFQTYLSDGNPSAWFTAIQKTNDALLDNFEALIADFRHHFGDSDLAGTAQRTIDNLQQTGSCANYAAKFKEQLPFLDLSEATKIFYFDRHLKKEVQAALIHVRPKPKTFEGYVKICIEIDNDIHSRKLSWKAAEPVSTSKPSHSKQPRQDTPRHNPTQSNSPPPSSQALPPGVPMEIDATRVSRPRGPLTPEEKERRRKLGHCLYCDGAGHNAVDCPNKKKAGSSSKSSGKA